MGGRAPLQVGDLVQLAVDGKRAPGKSAVTGYGLSPKQVLRIEAVIPRTIYGRKAFQVKTGNETAILWASQVNRGGRRRPRLRVESDE